MSINPKTIRVTTKPADDYSPTSWSREVIGGRALNRIDGPIGDYLLSNGVRKIVLAGGALLKGVAADLDFYPSFDLPFREAFRKLVDSLSGPTDDFAETSVGSTIMQFSFLKKRTTPGGILQDFDFAHCQVAVELAYCTVDDHGQWMVYEVSTTRAWESAMLSQGTFYTGGGVWPLRSLARIPKVAAKLGLSKMETQELAFQVTAEIAKRGIDKVISDDPSFATMMGINNEAKGS